MTALLKDHFLWLITQDVLVLVSLRWGKGNWGRSVWVFQYTDVYEQAAQTHIAPCVASLTTCTSRRSLHSVCPVLGRTKYNRSMMFH